jgi:hypothetical protein
MTFVFLFVMKTWLFIVDVTCYVVRCFLWLHFLWYDNFSIRALMVVYQAMDLDGIKGAQIVQMQKTKLSGMFLLF